MGGSDQWGNIVTGTEIIRKKTGGTAFAFTCPLLTKADGGKFGKTEKGNIWLAADKTSPFQFYQFWLNSSDTDAESWIKIFTFLSQEDILNIQDEHRHNPSARLLQKTLAEEVTKFVHGEDGLKDALETTQKLFASQNASAESLNVDDLENMDGIVKFNFALEQIEKGIDVVTFLAETNIFPSKGEAKKMIQNAGVMINRKKVEDLQQSINSSILLHKKYILVQKGKKNFYLVEVS